jgi:hypothetical protein
VAFVTLNHLGPIIHKAAHTVNIHCLDANLLCRLMGKGIWCKAGQEMLYLPSTLFVAIRKLATVRDLKFQRLLPYHLLLVRGGSSRVGILSQIYVRIPYESPLLFPMSMAVG